MSNQIFKKRIKAALIDCSILVVVLNIVLELLLALNTKDQLLTLILGFICYGYIFLKDILGGQSIGKRIFKIIVISENGTPATLKQLILRNIFLLVWPIEVYIMKDNVKPRIGDSLAKTKVIYKFDIEQ